MCFVKSYIQFNILILNINDDANEQALSATVGWVGDALKSPADSAQSVGRNEILRFAIDR